MTQKSSRSFTINQSRKEFRICTEKFNIELGRQTKIMGILNITPDSFSNDGKLNSADYISNSVKLGKKFVREGADILDIGGESSRPGAKPISVEEELRRVIPVIQALAKWNKVPISVDTYKPEVAHAALDSGASIINNIMGTKITKRLIRMVDKYNAALVLMHIKGKPINMQKNIKYINMIEEVISGLEQSIDLCLECGLGKDKIIIDPGIGFGKTVEDNLEILNRLNDFAKLNLPILIGTSRKSFIGHVLQKSVHKRLNGSLATTAISITKGAHIIRAHDIKENREAALMADAIINTELRGHK